MAKDSLQLALDIINTDKNKRQFYEPKWYVSYNAYENNHFVVWLPNSKQIKKIPIQGNKFFNQIPEITKQVDTIENMLLSPEIVPIVYPVDSDDPKTEAAREYWASKISDYCMYLYKHWMFNGVLHDSVHDALVMPCSYFELLPPETNNGKMELLHHDSFDIFHAPGIRDVQSPECNHIGKTKKLEVMSVRNNDNYNANRKKVKGSSVSTAYTYKDILQAERLEDSGDSNEETDTTIVDELWIKEKQDNGKIKIRVITVCEGMILRDELTDYDRFPFVSLKLHQGKLYQPSFVEYLLPINRSMDLLQSRMEDAALKAVRAALLAPYGSNITRTTDQNGEIIYYRGTPPEWQQPFEMPPFFINYLNMQFGWMERYGASAVTMGASPKGTKTYRTVEAVRQQDYASMKTAQDFMKIALTQLFNLVIYFASNYYLDPVGVKIYQQQEYDTFQVLGERGVKHNMDKFEAAQGDMTQAPVVVHHDNVVEIEFESALSYTMEGKRQTIMEMQKMGWISAEDALRMSKVGNVRKLLENLEKEKIQQMQMQIANNAAQQRVNAMTGANQPQGGGEEPPSGMQGSPSNTPEAPNTMPTAGGQPSTLPGIRVGQ